ncbi:MAG: hypothetical protein RDV48_28755 [Candidatus Eremiobacteraeota bacterium]|nr:hypothetical protein [Candidatus Eremiobacteraeota bacterium]
MPVFEEFFCDTCDFSLPPGGRGYLYALDKAGTPVVCPHPGEIQEVFRITGLPYSKAVEAGKAGFAERCACLRCLTMVSLDLARDPRACPSCGSTEVKSLTELIGQPCPGCGRGVFLSGKKPVKLDNDRHLLPVPEVVKTIVALVNCDGPGQQNSPEPRELSRAWKRYSALPSEDNGNVKSLYFTFPLSLLLRGFSDYPGQESGDYQWEVCENPGQALDDEIFQSLLLILQETPGLCGLVSLSGGKMRFDERVPEEVRRGIRNYVREHLIVPQRMS